MSEVIDHVGIRVSDLAASRRIYAPALAELDTRSGASRAETG
jgi:hypothetical protein